MKNITNQSIREDYKVITELFHKYKDAIYENQEKQPAHYDNQSKFVRLTISDVRVGLSIASNALEWLMKEEIKED